LTLVLVIVLFAGGYLPVSSEILPDKLKQITFGMGWEPVSFYPLRALDSASYYGQTLVYEGLVGYDQRLRIVPALSESFSVSADQLEYRFKLRSGARFGDGQAVTIKDVVDSVKLAMAPTSPYRADYLDIEKIEVKDRQTIVLHLGQPCAPLLSRLVELRILPARLLGLPDGGRNELARHPIGSGPFRLRSWESGSELVFEPNPFYWGSHPTYDRLVWKIVPDHSLLAVALKNGELDVVQCEAVDWSDFLSKQKGNSLLLDRFPGSRTVFLGFNLGQQQFGDNALRQALSMAIDREAIVNGLYSGYATIAGGDFASSSWAYNSGIRQWPFDLREARKKLLEAGFQAIDGRWRRRSTGELLAFSIATVKEYQSIAECVATDLHKLGISAEVQLVEFTTLRQQYLKKGQFQTAVWSRSVGPEPDCYLAWHSRGPLNFYKYSNPKVDCLLEEGRRTGDQLQRRQIYWEIQKLLSEELPWLFLVHPDLLLAHDQSVTNLKLPGQNSSGLPWDNPLFNAARWTKR
jgi:peptide/nickel transport system substrate-binding protein